MAFSLNSTLILGQRMVVCVLKHTPGVFVDYTNENETVYSGLEVEVFMKSKIQSRNRWLISALQKLFSDYPWHVTDSKFYRRIL